MVQARHRVIASVGALIGALALGTFHLHADESQRAIFVIALENHNWEQPVNKFTGGIQQIYQNPAAPFINSLVDGTAAVVVRVAGDDVALEVNRGLDRTQARTVLEVRREVRRVERVRADGKGVLP